jgi:hypothetical protein
VQHRHDLVQAAVSTRDDEQPVAEGLQTAEQCLPAVGPDELDGAVRAQPVGNLADRALIRAAGAFAGNEQDA